MGDDAAKPRPGKGGDKGGRGEKGAPAKPGGGVWMRIFKFLVAVALLPACAGVTLGARDHFSAAWTGLDLNSAGPGLLLKYFALGVGSFAVCAVLLWRPIVVYVFGHELVHALATWLCGGNVSNLSASANGGQVSTSKSNTFIRLAPYFIPLYVLLAAGIYAGLNTWWRPLGEYIQWLAFALGFFYAFHVGFSLWSLRHDQPDLRPDGWLFSLVVIYVANLAVFVLLFGYICEGHPRGMWPALKDSSQLGWGHVTHIYQSLHTMIQQAVHRIN